MREEKLVVYYWIKLNEIKLLEDIGIHAFFDFLIRNSLAAEKKEIRLTYQIFPAFLGYSRSNAMCSRYSSCSIVLDHGFHAAFLVAHEVAHS
jgi:hypothetical protein